MNLRKNLIDIFNRVGNDEILLRLLYYTSDPLNPSKQDVKSLPDFQKIRSERIIRSPKTDDLTVDNTICRICMYMGNRSSINNRYADQDIIFDVYAHIDKYDKNDARALWICDRINELLSLERVTGIGKMLSDRMLIIANPPSGYIGYRLVYTFGSAKK
jgi:hypothetical protein